MSKDDYCNPMDDIDMLMGNMNGTSDEMDMMNKTTNMPMEKGGLPKYEPNTALLSTILMLGTYMIANGLKGVRNGKYMGRTVSIIMMCFHIVYKKC